MMRTTTVASTDMDIARYAHAQQSRGPVLQGSAMGVFIVLSMGSIGAATYPKGFWPGLTPASVAFAKMIGSIVRIKESVSRSDMKAFMKVGGHICMTGEMRALD